MDVLGSFFNRVMESTLFDECFANVHENDDFFIFNTQTEEFEKSDGSIRFNRHWLWHYIIIQRAVPIRDIIVYCENEEGEIDFTNPILLGIIFQRELNSPQATGDI